MGLLVEGIGDDWIVTRKAGDKPELTTFGSLTELKHAIRRLLHKTEKAPSRPSIPLPVASERGVEDQDDALQLGEFPPETDCRDCGACCGTQDDTGDAHVKLVGNDLSRLPNIFRNSLVVSRVDGEFLKTKRNADGDTVCAALSGIVGVRCKCGIYEQRPLACRIFEPGSLECLLARKNRDINSRKV